MGVSVVSAACVAAFEQLGEAATYTPAGGSGVSLLAFVAVADPTRDFGSVSGKAPGHVILLRQGDVPTLPAAGDTVVIGSDTYTIRTVEHGPQDAVWRCGTAKE